VSAPPVFVVVGHVNRGKSSVVSTLAADETAAIDMSPGTTQHCRAYPMRVDG
jgi:GTP-binding protein EngB required for normal cell division